ncbi:hypothetical protein [Parapedobacter koreensis]|uniref:Membrane or secreted protein n=1 Tax=Parapedobacter koreensis TaxID=332977 RepID=A0A1H7IGC5_9SPHI|nr:hypothetical protein [Parapedobacter koreensis]SEK61508.1 hypothetical protein SAMN05421740_102229 [Parapedobacter koreensis]
MKRYLILSLLTICATSLRIQAYQADALAGAWHTQQGDIEQTAVFVDGYVSHSTYDVKNKTFVATRGGTYSATGGKLTITWQYDTEKAANETPINTWLGQSSTFAYQAGTTLTTDLSGSNAAWQRIDGNEGPMAGVWYMSGRMQGDEIAQRTLQDRRTLKILSGKRFQWVAINIKTGQFSGTGGGTYTFGNGKYTENIDFFSRGGDRVGMSLPFDDQIIDGQWHHTGKSSAGDPMHEVWSRLKE